MILFVIQHCVFFYFISDRYYVRISSSSIIRFDVSTVKDDFSSSLPSEGRFERVALMVVKFELEAASVSVNR